MSELDVRIVRLEAMRVAASYGFGSGPEPVAWEKLANWIKQSDLMQDGQTHRFFGFNNPDPAPGSPNYGYEQWVTIGPDTQPEGEVKAKEFGGGLYAVTRCNLTNIVETWMQFMAWHEKSRYQHAGHQYLEEIVSEPFLDKTVDEIGPENVLLDLYMPIAE